MSITITCRHADITDTIRNYVDRKIKGVLSEYPNVQSAHVIMDIEKFRHIVEVVIQAKQHVRVEAKDETDDMYKSIDQVMDKVDRQLRRSREKVIERKAGKNRERLSDVERKLGGSEP